MCALTGMDWGYVPKLGLHVAVGLVIVFGLWCFLCPDKIRASLMVLRL
jgi:hypothetical protein